MGTKPGSRKAAVERKTKETRVKLTLDLDGKGELRGRCPVPFLEHMLTLLAYHGKFDINITAAGDIEVDDHHLVEDVGLALGQALRAALGAKKGINRYGWCLLPMDEALAAVAVDISGRPMLHADLKVKARRLGDFDTELLPEFLRAFVNESKITLHIDTLQGRNSHHIVEAAFKGMGRALRQAVALDPKAGEVPSSKGMIE